MGLSYSDGMEEAFFRKVPAYLKQFIAEFGERRNDGEKQMYNLGNTAQLCLRAAAVFLPHFFSLKNEKYIQYSFVFQTLN